MNSKSLAKLGLIGISLLMLIVFFYTVVNEPQTQQKTHCLSELLDNPFQTQYNHKSTYHEKIQVNETYWVWHIWNEKNHYYIDPGGMQLTNHYLDYWTHNVWCLWINTSSGYQRRCSDGMNWNWVNSTDGETWVELNGTATYSEGPYSAIFRVRYYLADGYDKIDVSLGLKNTGQDVSDMYYGWLVKNIRVNGDEINDIGRGLDLNDNWHEYNLSDDLSKEWNQTQMKRHYQLKDNITSKTVDFWWDSKGWKNDVEYDDITFKLNLTHSLFPNQYNTPVLLKIGIGSLNNGETAYTNFWWVDADWTESVCSCTIGGDTSCDDGAGCGAAAQCRLHTCTKDACPARTQATGSNSGCACSARGCACFGTCLGTASCSVGGTCAYTCNAGYSNCDGDNSNGCEYNSDSCPPKFSNNATNTTIPGHPCNFTLDWTDDVGLFNYIFSTNNSGTWANASLVSFSGTSNTSWNVTTLNSTVGALVQWKFYGNDTHNNWNTSLTYNLTITDAAPTYSLNSTNSTVAGTAIEHRLKWVDDVGLSGYIFSFDNATSQTYYHNFTDTSNNKAWNNSDTSEPPSSLTPTGETEFSSGAYTNVSTSNNEYFNTSSEDHPYHKFNITINSSTNEIESINITWEGHCSGTAKLYVYNFTSGSWGSSLGSHSGMTDGWINKSITSGFSDYINSGKMSILVQDPATNLTAVADGDYSTVYGWGGEATTVFTRRYYGSSNYQTYGYFKFDLSSLGDIINATMYLYVQEVYVAWVTPMGWYNVTDDDWNETSGPPGGTHTLMNSQNVDSLGWHTFDVTDFVISEFAGDQVTSFKFYPQTVESSWEGLWFVSINNTTHTELHPTLEVWTTVAPTISIATDFIQIKVKEKQFINDTWTEMTGTGNWSNVTKTVNENVGKTVQWIVYANDTSNLWNASDIFSFVTTSAEVNYPQWVEDSNSTNTTVSGSSCNFTLNWTDVEGLSGYIFSTNNSGTWANASLVSFSGTSNTSWNVTTLNSTVGALVQWKYYANDTSNNWNTSLIYNLTTTSDTIVSIVLSPTLSEGILFNTVKGNTIGNPAKNNSNQGETKYNVTVGPTSTVNLDFYFKINETFPTNVHGNESSSTTSSSSGFSTNTTFTNTWSILGNSTLNCTDISPGGNCWIRFYLDVGNVADYYIERNSTICGIENGGDSGSC